MLALVVALCAGQVLAVPNPEGPIFSSPSTSGTGATFEFAPASGAGLPSITPLCDVLTAGEKVGNWFCQNGDGSMASGSTITLSATGSPALISQRICPNGPDCAAISARQSPNTSSGYLEGSSVDRSASVSTGGFTQCWHGVVRETAVERELMGLSTNGGGTWRNMMYFTGGSNVFQNYIAGGVCGVGATTVSSGLSVTPGAAHLLCLSWSASDGNYRTFVDGVPGGISASYTTICGGGSSSRYVTLGYWNGALASAPVGSYQIGAFDTSTQLSAARIAAIARAVLADAPTGARGDSINFTRTGARFCASSDNTGSMVPTNRLCVSRSAARTDGVSDDLLVRRRDLSNAAWTDVGTPTLGNTIAPDGSYEAWTITDDNAAAFEGRSQVYATVSLNRYLGSLCLRAGTATSARLRLIGTGNAAGDVTATFTGLTSSWRCGWDLSSPIKAVSPANYAAGLTAVTYEITVGDTVAVTGTIDVAFPQLEVAQSTTLAAPTMFCDGAAAAIASCGNDNLDRTGIPAPIGSACTAMTVQGQSEAWQSGGGILAPILTDGAAGAVLNGALYWWPFSNSNGGSLSADSVGAVSAGLASFNPVFGVVGSGTHRFLQAHTGSAWRVCQNGTCSTSGASTLGTPAFTRLKMDRPGVSAGNHPAQWVSRVQYDSTNYLRCTP